MTKFLPPNLLSLFFPREPLPYKPPPNRKKCPNNKKLTGMAVYVDLFEEQVAEPVAVFETRFERHERKLRERQERATQILEEKKKKWDPKVNENATTDPYKTIFISRLSYETTESRLKREFEIYGPIRTIRMINEKLTEKPRGYAFIEFEHTRDMHAAYKHMDGKKVDGKRILVDAERGRTESGGLGGESRIPKKARSEPPVSRSDDFEDRRPRNFDRNMRDRENNRGRFGASSTHNSIRSERRRSRSRHDSRRNRDDDRQYRERDRRH